MEPTTPTEVAAQVLADLEGAAAHTARGGMYEDAGTYLRGTEFDQTMPGSQALYKYARGISIRPRLGTGWSIFSRKDHARRGMRRSA